MFQTMNILEIAYLACLGLLALFILIFLAGKEKAAPGLLRALTGDKRFNYGRMRVGVLVILIILFVIEAAGLIYHEKSLLVILILGAAAIITCLLGLLIVGKVSRLKPGERGDGTDSKRSARTKKKSYRNRAGYTSSGNTGTRGTGTVKSSAFKPGTGKSGMIKSSTSRTGSPKTAVMQRSGGSSSALKTPKAMAARKGSTSANKAGGVKKKAIIRKTSSLK